MAVKGLCGDARRDRRGVRILADPTLRLGTAVPLGELDEVVALVMLGVGLLAAIGPARRGLGVQPSEALREG